MATYRQMGKYKTAMEMNQAIIRLKKKLKVKTLLVSSGYNDIDKWYFEYELNPEQEARAWN